MTWHQIQVDDEVFSYLQSKAAPFVDAPNDVLRKELLNEQAGPRPALTPQRAASSRPPVGENGHGPRHLPNFGFGTPAALEQTLWVIHLVRETGRTRPEATTDVAKTLQVAPQTVLDKYCRQLGLTADRFDLMLREPNLAQLQALLCGRFPKYAAVIRAFISALRQAA